MEIYQSCLLSAISINVQWIPRDVNARANELRKSIDYTINDSVFRKLDHLWGPHTCGRFTCHYNAKFNCFNSKLHQPSSSGGNAFSQDCSYHNNWLCPPVYLTCKVISHLKLCIASGTLIVPLWNTAHFWPHSVLRQCPLEQLCL